MLAIILYSPTYTTGNCELTELPKSNDVCVASLQCDKVILGVLSSWDCIRSVDYDYSYRRNLRREKITYATNYKLYVNVKNVDDQHEIFESVADNMKNIEKFRINDGEIFALPQKVYEHK
ncbi:Uncharacterized protein OBRU01_04698, partial [Operophtera brumata]